MLTKEVGYLKESGQFLFIFFDLAFIRGYCILLLFCPTFFFLVRVSEAIQFFHYLGSFSIYGDTRETILVPASVLAVSAVLV